MKSDQEVENILSPKNVSEVVGESDLIELDDVVRESVPMELDADDDDVFVPKVWPKNVEKEGTKIE